MKDVRRGQIYVLHCLVTNKKYVGKALKTSAEKRWDGHIVAAFQNRSKPRLLIHKAIRKYGVENFTAEVVETRSAAQLNGAEKRWIKKLRTLAPSGYNLTEGGDGSSGFKHRRSTKRKMKTSALRVWQDQAHRELMSRVHTGFIVSDETRAKISAARKGHGVSVKTRSRLSFTTTQALANNAEWAARIKHGLHRTLHTDAAKAKMSVAQKCRWVDDYENMYSATQSGLANLSKAKRKAWGHKCSVAIKAAWTSMTAEERSERALKAWAVRRHNALVA